MIYYEAKEICMMSDQGSWTYEIDMLGYKLLDYEKTVPSLYLRRCPCNCRQYIGLLDFEVFSWVEV